MFLLSQSLGTILKKGEGGGVSLKITLNLHVYKIKTILICSKRTEFKVRFSTGNRMTESVLLFDLLIISTVAFQNQLLEPIANNAH